MSPAFSRRVGAAIVSTFVIVGCGGESTGPHTPASPPDLGTFSLTVTGALNGTTHLTALPILDSVNTRHNFIGMNSPQTGQGFYALTVLKASSDLGPADGYDNISVDLNPRITQAGVYHNNSCTTVTGGPAACVGIFYAISNLFENQTPTNRGTLNNLQDDRDVITIDQIDSTKLRLSITGPFTWTRLAPGGGAWLTDTVSVTASFEAYQMHP